MKTKIIKGSGSHQEYLDFLKEDIVVVNVSMFFDTIDETKTIVISYHK